MERFTKHCGRWALQLSFLILMTASQVQGAQYLTARKFDAEKVQRYYYYRTSTSCWSQRESHLYRVVSTKPSQPFIDALNSYRNKFGACTNPKELANPDVWTSAFTEEGYSGGAKDCKYIIINDHGLENASVGTKLLSAVAIFLYALLTERTLLVTDVSTFSTLLCNPFNSNPWTFPAEVLGRIVEKLGDKDEIAPCITKVTIDESFFCSGKVEALGNYRVQLISTLDNFIPGLYAIPEFKEKLMAYFPDNRPFLHAARFLLHPNNVHWDRITRFFQALLSHAAYRVNIQVHVPEARREKVMEDLLKCAVEEKTIIPHIFQPSDSEYNNVLKIPPKHYIAVISSVVGNENEEAFDKIKTRISDGVPEGGAVISVTRHKVQSVGDKKDTDDLDNIFLASFCDVITTWAPLTSSVEVAGGLAGRSPLLMKDPGTPDSSLKCLSIPSEPTFKHPPPAPKCEGAEVHSFVTEALPFIKAADHLDSGILLDPSPVEEFIPTERTPLEQEGGNLGELEREMEEEEEEGNWGDGDFPIFDLEKAKSLWLQEVGCNAFKARVDAAMNLINQTKLGSSLQDVENAECSAMKKKRVVLDTKGAPWWFESIYHLPQGEFKCPRCDLTCSIEDSVELGNLTEAADAEMFVQLSYRRPGERNNESDPLRVFFATSPDGHESASNWDVLVSYLANSTLQVTMYGLDATDRDPHLVQTQKRNDMPVMAEVDFCKGTWRNRFLRSLFRRISHHSFGTCENNMDTASKLAMYPECKSNSSVSFPDRLCLLSRYKFFLAVEEDRGEGFVTERAFAPLESGTVPIYIGAPDIQNFMPPGSYIDATAFSSITRLAAHIKGMHTDPVKYMDYLAWKTCNLEGNYAKVKALGARNLLCRLCEKISTMR